MTDVQLSPPLLTRPFAPSCLQTFFAGYSLALTVTGVALFAILGFGALFLASQSCGKAQESDDRESPEEEAGSRNGASSSKSVVGDCQVIQDNLAKYATCVPNCLVEEFCNYNQQVTPDNIKEAKCLLYNLRERVPEVEEGIFNFCEFSRSYSSPSSSSSSSSSNQGGMSNRDLIEQQNNELEVAQLEDNFRIKQEKKEAKEKSDRKAREELDILAQEERRKALEIEKQKRISEYKKSPVESCQALTQEIQGVLKKLKPIDQQLEFLQGFCTRYEKAKNIRQPLKAEEIKKLEEKDGFKSNFIETSCLSQCQNEFQQRCEEVFEALPQAKLYSDLYTARGELTCKYEEYAKLILNIQKNAPAYSKWESYRPASGS